ncbi:metal ABC transporter substrate-binding protein [Camelimonas abortus]|uniref:Metal ABC transporter substrate-binding protein n=1 Tax=Camelimonas abortus TaxID=1017184 RepID=A0ABV7LEH4_9HYPH
MPAPRRPVSCSGRPVLPARRRLLGAAALAACLALLPGAAVSAHAEPGPKLPVTASFSILADMARRIGGERVEVTELVGPGGDVHVFSPAPADARRIAGARLIITNGLALEGWMPRLIRAAGAKAPVVEASRGVAPAGDGNGGHAHAAHAGGTHGGGGAHAHGHAGLDPHAWQDVRNAVIYAQNIRDGLVRADPDGRETYERNAAAYIAELQALDADIRRMMAHIPPARRRIITTHDAFGYFGRAYGLELLAPQGLSTESEPSATDVARVIRQIREAKAPAVFLEDVANPRLMQQIARETGAKIGGRLYTDSLTPPDGPAPDYVAMMRHNAGALAAALAE